MIGVGDQIYMPPQIDAPHMHITPPRFEEPEPPCRTPEHEDEFFGPEEREPYHGKRLREHRARRLCQGCPFFLDCALHGLEHEEFGVWGGLSEHDRAALGGTGHVKSGPGVTRRKTIERLGLAGFTVEQIGALLDAWKRRRRTNNERGAA